MGVHLERLQKYLAHAGIASRRKCEELISAGMVKVNGEVIREMGTKVVPGRDKIEVAGKPVENEEEKVYFLLNKPKGYVTTIRDPQGRPKVTDLLKDIKQRVYPVGRLDFETRGLLLLTNDGEMTYALTHPKHEIGKTYAVLVLGVPSADKVKRFAKGLRLSDGVTAPAGVRILKKMGGNALLQIIIHEGRNRQIRRMCETIGHPVLDLQRTAIGFLQIEGLEEGKHRPLKNEEIKKLKAFIKAGGQNQKRNLSVRG